MLPTMSVDHAGLVLGTLQIGDMPELCIARASQAATLITASTT